MLELFNLEENYLRFRKIKREQVVKLLKWIKAQPHLPDIPEQEVLLYYFACRYSVELSKKVLDANLTYHTHLDEFFANLDVERPEFKRVMNTLAICTLPNATPEGYRVIIAKLIDTDVSNFSFDDSVKLYCLILELWLREDGIHRGHVIVMDLDGCTMEHVAKISLLQMKKFLYYLQEASALRIVSFHFINTVSFIDKILDLMNPFLKKELESVLYLHNAFAYFYRFVPQNILPQDYDGPEMEMINFREITYAKLRENRKEIMEYERVHRVNEELRPGKPKTASELFSSE